MHFLISCRFARPKFEIAVSSISGPVKLSFLFASSPPIHISCPISPWRKFILLSSKIAFCRNRRLTPPSKIRGSFPATSLCIFPFLLLPIPSIYRAALRNRFPTRFPFPILPLVGHISLAPLGILPFLAHKCTKFPRGHPFQFRDHSGFFRYYSRNRREIHKIHHLRNRSLRQWYIRN